MLWLCCAGIFMQNVMNRLTSAKLSKKIMCALHAKTVTRLGWVGFEQMRLFRMILLRHMNSYLYEMLQHRCGTNQFPILCYKYKVFQFFLLLNIVETLEGVLINNSQIMVAEGGFGVQKCMDIKDMFMGERLPVQGHLENCMYVCFFSCEHQYVPLCVYVCILYSLYSTLHQYHIFRTISRSFV